MSSDILAGTDFPMENDVYSRIATQNIVIKGKYPFNSVPQKVITAKHGLPTFQYSNSTDASNVSRSILTKVYRSQV